MMKKMMNSILAGSMAFMLASCASTDALTNHRHLAVETKVSNSIFLQPVAASKRTVFLQVRNTSGKSGLSVGEQIRSSLQQEGYKLVNDPAKATYLLQANVRQAGQVKSLSDAQHLLSGGFGGAVLGGVAGSISKSNKGVAIGALAGAAIGSIASAFIKDVTYVVVTDVQLSEKTNKVIKTSTVANLQQGTSTASQSSSSGVSHWQRYRVRIVSSADKVNLEFAAAEPQLAHGIASAIAGMF